MGSEIAKPVGTVTTRCNQCSTRRASQAVWSGALAVLRTESPTWECAKNKLCTTREAARWHRAKGHLRSRLMFLRPAMTSSTTKSLAIQDCFAVNNETTYKLSSKL